MTETTRYQRILLKLSGEALLGKLEYGVDPEVVAFVAEQVKAVTALGVQVGIVVTGSLVRLTGSGLGCPTWPRCTEGSFVPVAAQDEGFHKWIEFGNRTLTFVLGLLAIAAVVAETGAAKNRVYDLALTIPKEARRDT